MTLKILNINIKCFIQNNKNTIIISNDDTGLNNIYFRIENDKVYVSNQLNSLVSNNKVSIVGIEFLLRNHTIPAPYTIFENVHTLTYGDIVTIDKKTKKISYNNVFPYFENNTKENKNINNTSLLDLLKDSLNKQLNNVDSSLLMLSSGKDSVSIAIALSELAQKNKTHCLTIDSGFSTDEGAIASTIANKLGLKHEIIQVNEKDAINEELLLDFYRNSPYVVTDFAQIPYLIALNRYKGNDNLQVIDGSASDVYVGHVPNKNGLIKHKFPVIENDLVKKLLPIFKNSRYRKYNFIHQYRSERFLEGLEFHPKEIKVLLERNSNEVEDYWKDLDSQFKYGDVFDFKNYVRGRLLDTYTYVGKIKLAANYFDYQIVLPWCDEALIDNYFNLPTHVKYSKKDLINKIPIRKMITDKIGLDLDAIGKRAFLFNKEIFFKAHEKFILNEIFKCVIWSKNIKTFVAHLRRNNDYNNLVVLFNISCWYNNSKFVRNY